jgi:hypothetical protein
MPVVNGNFSVLNWQHSGSIEPCTGYGRIGRFRIYPLRGLCTPDLEFMHNGLFHWLMASGSLIPLVVTAGVAVLLVCCLGCSKCPCREKDNIFGRHEV